MTVTKTSGIFRNIETVHRLDAYSLSGSLYEPKLADSVSTDPRIVDISLTNLVTNSLSR